MRWEDKEDDVGSKTREERDTRKTFKEKDTAKDDALLTSRMMGERSLFSLAVDYELVEPDFAECKSITSHAYAKRINETLPVLDRAELNWFSPTSNVYWQRSMDACC